jgi:PucR family transcriptional regulator, purine catabolism regulatory protein
MPLTLASLVLVPALRLTVLAGKEGLDVPVRWVHTSELDDPAPFLEGGELLLTTGIKFGAGNEALRGYVRRLADVGVVGLGVGVGLTHERVPDGLVEAAAQLGLPLLEVPQPTPFIAISKAVSAALAAERYQAVTAAYEAQREFARAALGKDGTPAVLRRLARRLDGWAALYDAAGRAVHAAPGWAWRRAERLTGDVARLRDRPARSGASVQEPTGGSTDCVELQSLGTGRRPRGFLAVGTEQRLTAEERYVVHSAAALLTLVLEQSRSLQQAEERLGAALLRMLLAGRPEEARTVAGPLYEDLLAPEGRVRLLLAVPAPEPGREPAEADQLAAFCDHLEGAALRAGEQALTVREGRRLVALVAEEGAVFRAFLEQLGPAGCGGALAAGASAALPPDQAVAAREQAERALSVALRRGRALVRHDEVGSGSVLPLLRDDAVRAFADALLRPLRDHDATSRGDLVESLRAWLNRHGQWDAAAADLDVHRHTLRYRMRRVEDLLDRSLDDADLRMELWLALRTSATR